VHLVDHGREVCKAHHPACGECSLSAMCTHARRVRSRETE
jgi:endonuclease III